MAFAQNSIIVSILFLIVYAICIVAINKITQRTKLISYLFAFALGLFIIFYNVNFFANLNEANIQFLTKITEVLSFIFYLPFILGGWLRLKALLRKQELKLLTILAYIVMMGLLFYLWRVLFLGIFVGFV